MNEWQRRKSAFNHDWLKNRYLNNLDGFIAVLEKRKPDINHLLHFLKNWRQWEQQKGEARWLLGAFETHMSPAVLFEEEPLNRLEEESGRWLKELIHSLWSTRYVIKKLIKNAENNFLHAENLYLSIDAKLNKIEHNPVNLKDILQEFKGFKKACKAFSGSLSKLPSEVLVV
jgi:hypothetical protein